MNKDNILAVADAIEKHTIADLGFNMLDFVSQSDRHGEDSADRSGYNCGTVACIAGWTRRIRTGQPLTPVLGIAFKWTPEADWLGLTIYEAEELFFGDEATNARLPEIEPAEAVAVLRRLAETGEVDWHAPATPSREQAQKEAE